MVRATIDLCTSIRNRNDEIVLQTRYSNWDCREFKSMEEAVIFGHGCVCALRSKWVSAAVRMCFDDGKELEITD